MMLIHTAGTVGGMTASGAALLLGAAGHYSQVPDVVIAVAGAVGAVVALLSYTTARKNDPAKALIAHAQLDDQRTLVIDQRLSEITTQLDTIVTQVMRNAESRIPPTVPPQAS